MLFVHDIGRYDENNQCIFPDPSWLRLKIIIVLWMVDNLQENTQWENTVLCIDFTLSIYLHKAPLYCQSQTCDQGMNGQGK